MPVKRKVPFWYNLECILISHRGTRFFLLLFLGLREKLHGFIEKRQLMSQPLNLRNFDKKVFSQNGEDGIIGEIFRRIGTTDRFFVEFGVQDGIQCCTRNLLENNSWSGVWIECSKKLASDACSQFMQFPIKIVNQFLTAENIVSVFEQAEVPLEFDLMVIDVDGNDYWMWNALVNQFHPRVVIIEYNATFGPTAQWVMPYDPNHRYDETAYFGASLSAYAEFAHRHDYCLVGCDAVGVNAFFVRKDAASAFEGIMNPPSYHYVAPHYGCCFGHPTERFD